MARSRISKDTTVMVWLNDDETIAESLDLDAKMFPNPNAAVREAMDLLEDQDVLRKRPVILYGASRQGDITIFDAIRQYSVLH